MTAIPPMADNIAQRIEAAERAARKATSYAWLVRWAAQGNGEVGAEQEPPANVSTPPGHHSAPPSDGSVFLSPMNDIPNN